MSLAQYLWAIPVFGTIILLHELGHFAAAKGFGIRVHEFAIGFGPTFASFTRGETRYTMRLFLILGGFVRMAGMEDTDVEDPRGFAAKPVWQRMVTIAAGPLMNFVLAVVLFAALVAFKGHPDLPARVQSVLPGTPAAAAGLLAGDTITAVDGKRVRFFSELAERVQDSNGRPLRIGVDRAGQAVVLEVRPQYAGNRWQIGIVPAGEPIFVPADWKLAVSDGFMFTGRVTQAWFGAFSRWVSGVEQPEVVGPVEITRTIARASAEGLENLLELGALLSINIGIINLFPFPALDGSRLVFLTVEAVRRRRLNPQRENLIHFVGLVLLLGLMAVITWSEVVGK